MNHIAPLHEPLIREVPLSRLALAPENVRKTPADPIAEAELKASIVAHGLLENLVVRIDGLGQAERYPRPPPAQNLPSFRRPSSPRRKADRPLPAFPFLRGTRQMPPFQSPASLPNPRHSSDPWRGTRSRQPPPIMASALSIHRRTCERIPLSGYHLSLTSSAP